MPDRALAGRRDDNPKLMPVPPWTGGVIAPRWRVQLDGGHMLKFAADVLDGEPAEGGLRADDGRQTAGVGAGGCSRRWGGIFFRRGGAEILAKSGRARSDSRPGYWWT